MPRCMWDNLRDTHTRVIELILVDNRVVVMDCSTEHCNLEPWIQKEIATKIMLLPIFLNWYGSRSDWIPPAPNRNTDGDL